MALKASILLGYFFFFLKHQPLLLIDPDQGLFKNFEDYIKPTIAQHTITKDKNYIVNEFQTNFSMGSLKIILI